VTARTVGVEEEFLLVDPVSGYVRPVAPAVLGRGGRSNPASPEEGGREAELMREQVETGTSPCTTITQLYDELIGMRRSLASAAENEGVRLLSSATSPLPVRPTMTTDDRYEAMTEAYGLTAREQLTCGCHVHVFVSSRDEAVAALDRIRPWLAALLALSVNSPFWQGEDTAYASYRARVWGRWPSSGPTEVFGSVQVYDDIVSSLVGSGVLLDTGMIYFEARVSAKYPTLEIRTCDACRTAEDTALLAALCRGLVETAVAAWQRGEEPLPVRTELLRMANWRAARSGLDGDLVSVRERRPVPAKELLDSLVDHIADALQEDGDLGFVRDQLGRIQGRGTGAALQRRALERDGSLAAVVADAVAATVSA
jgi:carboxylate-amine ligase